MIVFHSMMVALASWVLLDLARRAAPNIGLVDEPNDRKIHERPTPLVGGLAVVPVLGIVALLYLPDLTAAFALVVAMTIIFFMGILDDLADIPASLRLFVQILAAGILIWFGDAKIDNLGALFGGDVVELGIFAEPFTMICIVAAINAFNMIDGADGLLASLTIISLLCLSALFIGGSTPQLAIVCLVSTLVLIPYLAANLMPHDSGKKVFMGDASSMVIGLFVAYLCIYGACTAQSFEPTYVMFAIAVPVFDLIRVFLARLVRGVSPFTPERNHIHHELSHTGKHQSLAIITSTAVGIACAGIFMQTRDFSPEYVTAMLAMVIVFLVAQVKAIRFHGERFANEAQS